MLILASSSRYRRELLARLGLPFETCAPQVDERPQDAETPAALAARLAAAKAGAARVWHAAGHVIGSDQVCECDGELFGKPGAHAAAVDQLRRLAGRTATFHTAVAVLDLAGGTQRADTAVTRVHFRELSDAEIERYLAQEPAYDCAGSFKSEGLGITLVERIDSDDPTALIGLPLVRLAALLRSFDYPL